MAKYRIIKASYYEDQFPYKVYRLTIGGWKIVDEFINYERAEALVDTLTGRGKILLERSDDQAE